jgi:hypothetical protein
MGLSKYSPIDAIRLKAILFVSLRAGDDYPIVDLHSLGLVYS